MNNSDQNLIAALAEKIERIQGKKPGFLNEIYRMWIERGLMTVDEAVTLLHKHYQKLELREASHP